MLWLIAALAVQTHPADHYVSVSSLTGAMLAEDCARERGLQMDLCASYIIGVSDALQLTGKTCRPSSEAATLQTITIARRYIAAHPEKWGWAPVFIVREALVGAFPCHKR